LEVIWGYIVTLSQNMKQTNTIQQSAKQGSKY